MNQKLIIILSVIIIFIGALGLLVNTGSKREGEVAIKQPTKRNYTFLIATRDINKGETIGALDITAETIEDDENKHFGNDIVDKNKDFVVDGVMLSSVSKGKRLEYGDVALLGSQEYNNLKIKPKNGYFSFAFPLKDEDLVVLQNLKTGDYADVYFKYQTKNKRNVSIVPKRDKNNQSYGSDGSISSANLMVFLRKKKILFIEKKIITDPIKQEEKIATFLHLELSQDEIKQIYAVESVGDFYIFPASGANGVLSTDNVLPKDFIKEYKGGVDGQK
ncbi:hypothetical protein [Helicobacter sp. 11S02596-1]|uniref:hypothetical protein n=1 Tax=Helicobacter sp. 11S02596-1 TaxID=1476194 RepID=UPI000BA579E0|nr:hypothetical protein [Helicobacter sp. 11S02596-1]PAF43637.1 hypothetical protein BJI48_05115 [Helicobacter sp. 11S02596-1]